MAKSGGPTQTPAWPYVVWKRCIVRCKAFCAVLCTQSSHRRWVPRWLELFRVQHFETYKAVHAHCKTLFFCYTWGSALYIYLAFHIFAQAVLPSKLPKLATSPPRDTTRLTTLLHSPCKTLSWFIWKLIYTCAVNATNIQQKILFSCGEGYVILVGTTQELSTK